MFSAQGHVARTSKRERCHSNGAVMRRLKARTMNTVSIANHNKYKRPRATTAAITYGGVAAERPATHRHLGGAPRTSVRHLRHRSRTSWTCLLPFYSCFSACRERSWYARNERLRPARGLAAWRRAALCSVQSSLHRHFYHPACRRHGSGEQCNCPAQQRRRSYAGARLLRVA